MRLRDTNPSMRYTALSICSVLTLVLLWFLLTPRVLPELVFPSPRSVYDAVVSLKWHLFEHAAVTLIRVLIGWSLGVLTGILAGILMTWSRAFYATANPIIEALRPVPPIALIPFFIIWFGLGPSGQIGLVALGCFMVLAVNTFVAVHTVPPVYVRAASSLGASKFHIYTTVIIPAIIPSLMSGFRIAAALAFGLGVAAEFMGAQSGLGYVMMVARRTLNTNTILLGIVLLGIESFLLDKCIRVVGRYLCRWSETSIDSIQTIGSRL